ncbi:hypothetical protein THIOM_005479, partial [Candidatus Thiomargarita nelsonii]
MLDSPVEIQSFSIPHFLKTLLGICPPTQRLWIAYSGGLDSHLLLYALAQLRPQFELRALTCLTHKLKSYPLIGHCL